MSKTMFIYLIFDLTLIVACLKPKPYDPNINKIIADECNK